MARRYILKNGESSFDGIHPATKTFCGIDFGYHNNKNYEGCAKCGKFTHYSIHRRYKFSRNLETNEQVDRLWCCSDDCFRAIIFGNMFDLVLPYDVAEKIITWPTGKKGKK